MKNISAAILLLFVCSPAFAQDGEGTASKSWWNPFSGGSAAEQDTKKSSFFNGSGGSKPMKLPSFSWPKPSFSQKQADASMPQKSSAPSAFSKFNAASKKFWSDTADFINPFDGPKQQPRTQGYRPQDEKQQKSKGGFFSWMKPSQEEQIQDVNGFLRQDRPRF